MTKGKRILRGGFFGLAAIVVILCIGLSGLGAGYMIHREQLQPVYGVGERVITRLRRDLGFPTETHDMVRRIETTYLTLRGTVYLMPDQEWRNGGGLSLWDDEVIVLHSSGKIMRLDEGSGLEILDLPVPENNLDAYIELAASDYPDQFPRPNAIRYNDIEFVDSPAFRGLLLSYTYIDIENTCYRTRISQLPVPRNVASIQDLDVSRDDWDLLYETNPCLAFNAERELIVGYMAGGRIAYKAPDLLYLGSGEYHREGLYRPDAGIQDADSDYGKTIEINLTSGTARHYSIGHRNLQGVTVDARGRLWTTEHGMRGGDELNLIRDQDNYGWPLENLGTLYSGVPAPTVGRVGRHEVYTAPVYAWLPSAAVSSLALVEGFHETWDGDLLIGSLKNRTLYRARIREDRVVFMEEIPIGQRIRDVMQVGPQKLALWLDTEEVVILALEERTDPLEGLVAALVAQDVEAGLAQTTREVLEGCAECHSFEANVHGAGPSLHKVFGRKIATSAFQGYSDALKNVSGDWTREALSRYIADPEGFAEGTYMTGLGVGNADVAEAMATAFEWLASKPD